MISNNDNPSIQNFYYVNISGFHGEVDENCVLLGYYTASSGNLLPTFRNNLSVPSSKIKNLDPWRWDP